MTKANKCKIYERIFEELEADAELTVWEKMIPNSKGMKKWSESSDAYPEALDDALKTWGGLSCKEKARMLSAWYDGKGGAKSLAQVVKEYSEE